ncbi:MAG: acylneuraminate cytidylyltransferase family protein [Cyclobacteriaceae bacterium]
MKILALIPARGGSKRIPQKNLREISGHPLLYYTIKFAHSIADFSEIVVSSDDAEILKYCKNLNINCIKRPSEFAEDTSSTGSVLKSTLEHFEKNDMQFDTIVTLQPTNPFRSKKNLLDAINSYQEIQAESLISVAEVSQKFGSIRNGIYLASNYSLGDRGQDMEKLYYETGQFYITSNSVARNGHVSVNPAPWICKNWFDSVDIDEPNDLKLAETLMTNFKKEADFPL